MTTAGQRHMAEALVAALRATGALPVDIDEAEPIPMEVEGTVTLAGATAVALRKHVEGDPGECCDMATETTAQAILEAVAAIPAPPTTVDVGNFPSSQPVTAEDLPLPDGAATDGKLDDIIDLLEGYLHVHDYLEDAGRGLIPGAEVHTLVALSPKNNASNVKQTLWPFLPESGPWAIGGDSYVGSNNPVIPSSATTLYLRSTSTQDSASGSGCRRVEVHYLDGSLVEKVVTVALDGNNRVQIATDILRVNRLYAKKDAGGVGASPAGNILCVPASALDIYHGMTIDRNISMGSFWTVPAGKRLGISIWAVGMSGVQASKAVRFTLGIKRSMDGDLEDFFYARAFQILPLGSAPTPFRPMVWVPAGTDFRTTLEGNTSGEASMTMEGLLEDA